MGDIYTNMVCIAGSRNVSDEAFVLETCKDILREAGDTAVLINGGARGVDKIAQKAAISMGIPVLLYLPDWSTHGKGAGPIRNKQMVADANEVHIIWDLNSRGTAHTARTAYDAGKLTSVSIIPTKPHVVQPEHSDQESTAV